MLNNHLIKLLIYIFIFFSSLTLEAKGISKVTHLENLTINYYFKDDESLKKESEINELISKAFIEYSQLFKGLPRDAEGEEYTEIDLHIKKGKYLGGEADPQLIMLTWNEDKLFGFATWQTMLLHELFHLWSAESFRYQDGKEHWFNEGFTEYYAYKTAVKLGFVSPLEMLSTASLAIGYYSSSVNVNNLSMREASKTNKTKFENYFLVYHGGWTVAMSLDHDIRRKTGSKKSLDNVMHWMHHNFPRNEKLYKLEDIITGIQQSTGIDYSKFIQSYVDGKDRIPFSEYLPIGDALWALAFNKKDKIFYQTLYETLGF